MKHKTIYISIEKQCIYDVTQLTIGYTCIHVENDVFSFIEYHVFKFIKENINVQKELLSYLVFQGLTLITSFPNIFQILIECNPTYQLSLNA